MHTTTPTLTAAAQSLRGRPYVRCRFQDHVVRWMQLRDDPGAATPSDSAYTAVGGEGYLVRIRNNAGAIQALRTNAPTSAAHWVTGWSTIADGATSGADVALAVFSAGKLRAFYHKSGAVRCIESSDGGATWANDHVAVAGAVGSERLAADNDALFVQNAQITLYRNSVWSATSWSIIGAWAGRTWTSPQGIGAAWQAEESRWVLVAAGNGKITTLTYGADYGNDRSWRAGADQAPASGADPRCPDVTIASVLGEPLYLISWIDRYDDGVHAWEQPSVRQSFDCCHFGMELPLDLPAAVHQRCALVYDALGGGAGYLWCANERAVCQAYIPLNWYTPDYEPVAFGRSERIDAPGMLELEIVNPPVALVALDSWTEETHAYQPLAQVALKRGYQTSAGNEFINVSPYYIVRLAYRDGLEGGALVVRAVDGWGLLDLFTPDMPFTWRNRTIRWLLAELAAQVGLDYDDDGSSRLGVSLGEFTLHAGQTARSAVLALLGLARAGARWTSDARAKLYVFELPNVEAAVSVGNQQEILQAEYGIQLVAPTTVAVSGDGAAARAADLAHAMHQGLDIPRCIVEHRATSSALAVRVRNRAQDLAGLRWRADRILVHLRPELQVWDRITLSSPCPAAGVDSARILTAIRESYDAQRGEYVSELELGEAIPE